MQYQQSRQRPSRQSGASISNIHGKYIGVFHNNCFETGQGSFCLIEAARYSLKEVLCAENKLIGERKDWLSATICPFHFLTDIMTMMTGSLVAIVTPMHADGSLDIPGLRKLIDWHISEGSDGIVIAGTTGESATVSVEEHRELIRVTVEHTDKRIPIIAGTGGNSTEEAIELTRYAKHAGADASLQVVPYYNRPTQEGMYQHFKKIAESVDIPIILYNVPGRTASDMSNETIVRLAQIPNIVGVKEASGNIGRDIELLALVPEDFAVYSGDDLSAMALMLCGGKGNISVTANVAPRAMHDLCVAALRGEIAKAIAINKPLIALHQKLFFEPNPVPVKWALAEMGMIPTGIRLPLVAHSGLYHESLVKSLRDAGLLKK